MTSRERTTARPAFAINKHEEYYAGNTPHLVYNYVTGKVRCTVCDSESANDVTERIWFAERHLKCGANQSCN